ncbi:AmpG family muropeptide MFS transporter [Indioceanicola profundi]|uniref:AmpG family muropeptide MFS transporter n=1 Tax=Indioceanicola profundi TaxID=2220096 RepID=UPI000E6AC259|nr:MFS transporter [Indioceanicola profundi]
MTTSETSPNATTADQPERRSTGWRDVLKALGRPRVSIMLLLGFSSGLPFLLTGNTLGFWLREGGIELATIGFLSWVGLAYSLKFLWAPIVDKVDAPVLGRMLGRRRGWMALSQLAIGAGLVGMSIVGPEGGLGLLAVFALLAAFASATQDVVVDAWRIECAASDEELGLLSAAYQLGYRAALLATDALILFLAAAIGWSGSYLAAGIAMGIGLAATLAAKEPARTELAAVAGAPTLWSLRGLFDAVVGPFIAFFRTHRELALLMLVTISLYRLPDFLMGPMANPLYVDLGLTKEAVGSVRATVGLWAAVAGVALGGISAVRLGFGPTLILGAVLGPASNIAFSVMAWTGPDIGIFATAMAIDNLSAGFAGVALVAYMSSLTSIGYTATQYALLTSFYALLGKLLKGFSGGAVEWLSSAYDLMTAYALFFLVTAAIGIPAVILCAFLDRATRRRDRLRSI